MVNKESQDNERNVQSCNINAIKSDHIYWDKEIYCFVLVICIYKQSLNELQQPNLTGIFGTNNKYYNDLLHSQEW